MDIIGYLLNNFLNILAVHNYPYIKIKNGPKICFFNSIVTFKAMRKICILTQINELMNLI